MIKLISQSTNQLKSDTIIEICNLKDQQWVYGLKSQKQYIIKYSKPLDLHNCLYFNEKLIGYTHLRKRTFNFNIKKNKYYLLDSFIINKKFRGKNFSKILMNFNHSMIIQSNIMSILFCDKKLINFYKKNKWKKLLKSKINILDKDNVETCMIFNFINKSNSIINLFTNK